MTFASKGIQRRIYGVDFSGAKDAGRKIWISEGVAEGNELLILNCYPAYELVPGGSKKRDECLSSLRDLIISNRGSVFGMDFPFSLPEKLLPGKEWYSFICDFADEYSDAETFRRCMQKSGGKTELKRRTDVEVKAPFSIYNLWVYKQTYHGIRDVLRPLLMEGKACALPMQKPLEDRPWLMEICPASTLKSEELYISYKGSSGKKKHARELILEGMMGKGIHVPEDIMVRIIGNKEGDALDSLIAAFATFRSLRILDDILDDLPYIYLREGYTFF